MNNRSLLERAGRRIACALSVFFLVSVTGGAQVLPEYSERQEKKEARKPFINRWAFRTNALEWLMTVPNFGLEFDLSPSDYNRSVIGLTAKYNWHTYLTNVPYLVFDMLDIRPEYRYYFRNLGGNPKKNARTAKYLGAYLSYGQYSFKFSEEGISGQSVGLGVSYGYALPLYRYRKGALDMDLGFSVGVQMTERDAFTLDEENNCYAKVAARSSDWHLTSFPVVSELRVAFVWRAVSVKDKYHGTDPRKRQIRLAEADIEMSFADIRASFDKGLSKEAKVLYDSDMDAYREGFADYVSRTADMTAENVSGYDVGKTAAASLVRKIERLERKAVREFDRSMKNKR